MIIKLPQSVSLILKVLIDNEFSAFVVGGCVRDSILGKQPKDWDITTSAKPNQVKALFKRTVDTGLKHGTVTVLIDQEQFEVTTFRIDGEYEDNRRPKTVLFTQDLIEDLKRRDFTINAMAYNDSVGLVDVFNGQKDLKNKCIRCVGNPKERFNEDALRMLRAIRFCAQLNFEIEQRTENAIINQAHLIKNISAERIQAELCKLLISNNPEKFKLIYDYGLLEFFMPEFSPCFKTLQNNPHHKYNVGEHTLQALTYTPKNIMIRLTILLHDIGKPYTKTTDKDGIDHFYRHAKMSTDLAHKILKRLKLDNKTIEYVTRLITYHDMRIKPKEKNVRRAINKIGQDIFEYLLLVQEADLKAQSTYQQKEKLLTLLSINQLFNRIKHENQCISIKQLKVSGRDIIGLGIKQGKNIGEILSYLLDIVLENPEQNQKNVLLDLAKKYIKQHINSNEM